MLLMPKKTLYDWVNSIFPNEPPVNIPFSPLENDEASVYLIPEFDCTEDFEKWIKKNFKPFFEDELLAWHTDPKTWPKNLTYNLFAEWFHISYQSLVLDSVQNKKLISEEE